jgi:hypothetical protein
VGLYPVGSVVQLSGGELAVVIKPGERDVSRPVVRVLRKNGDAVAPYVVSLDETPDQRVVSVLDPADVPRERAAFLADRDGAGELAG